MHTIADKATNIPSKFFNSIVKCWEFSHCCLLLLLYVVGSLLNVNIISALKLQQKQRKQHKYFKVPALRKLAKTKKNLQKHVHFCCCFPVFCFCK